MSVDYIDTYKLAEAISIYASGLHDFHGVDNSRGPTIEQFAGALVALHYANVMAVGLSYPADRSTLPDLIDPQINYNLDPVNVAITAWDRPCDYKQWVVRAKGILLWNTVTNGGIHCLPRKHEETVERAIHFILGGLAGLWDTSG